METAELQSPDSEQKPVSSPMDGRRQSVESNKTNYFEPASPPANCIKNDEENPNEEETEARDLDPTSTPKDVGELTISEENSKTDNLESASPKEIVDEEISEEIETSNDQKLSIPPEDLCQNDEIEISSDEEPTVPSEDVCQNDVPTEDACENDVPPENVCENDEIEISSDEEPEAPPEDVCQNDEIEISSDEEPSVPPEDVSQNDEIEMPGDQEPVSPPKDVRQDDEEIVNEQNIPTNDQEPPCLLKDDEQDSNEVTSPKPSETSSSDEDEEAEKQLTIVDDDVDEQMDETEQSSVQEPESNVQEPESIVQEQEEMQIDSGLNEEEGQGVQLTNDEHLETNHESNDLEKDVPVIVQTPVLKLNGNHSISLNDEDSCSSSSSASSHNLVIDHPLAEEQPPPANSSALEKENSLPRDVHKTNEPKSLKRKLSLSCESDSPQFKHIHLDVAEAKSPEHEKENYEEHKGLLSVGNQLTAPWERSNDTTNFPKDEPQSIKFVEGHVPPVTRFSQPSHANYREPESVILKEKPPPPYEAFQSSKGLCEDPTKLLSPQNYGQYAVFNSCIVPPVAFATEALTPEHFQNAKALPDSYTRLVPVPSSIEPSIGSGIMPPPSINEPTPATETSSSGPIATSLQKPSQPIIGSYDRYTTPAGKSLPPPKLNFECFKCKSVVFESFAQLREHHKCCLLSDNNRHPPAPAPAAEPLFLAHLNEKTVALTTAPGPLEKINSLTTATPPPTTKRRFYLCSSCGTYHENWNLFLHIREIHNRHVCLYCIRLFPTAEKLSLHLEIKHDLEQNHFNSEEKLRSVSKNDGNSRFLMCCSCQHVFSEHERFSDHVCTEYIQPCSLCGQKGRHLSNCKANPEKRPKAKRKSKAIAAGPPAVSAPSTATVPPKVICKIPKSIIPPYSTSGPTHNNNSSNFQQMAFPVLPQPSMAAPNLEFSKQNGYTEMPFADGHSKTKPPPSEDYNYNSDDSTNMVIDETCSTNNYFNEMPAVNPFKALDERERQEAVQKTAEIKSTLPPDRVAEAILEPKPLIVPKIKLCVPKQFQKAVDMAISSSDSNEDDQDSDAAEQEDHQQSRDISVGNATRTSSTDEKDSGQEDGGGGGGGGGEQLNSKLDRILKAIEKTQCEIRRTKEKLMRTSPTIPEATIEDHSSFEESPAKPLDLPPPLDVHYEVPPTEEARPEFSPVNLIQEPEEPIAHTPSALYAPTCEASKSPISVVMKSWNTPEHGMYSPTPPPTPTSVWPSPSYQPDDSPTVIQAVSERENIENMEKEEKECEHSTKEKTPDTETDKMNSSSELDVETIHNQEDSTMDIEEKSKQTPPRSSPPLQVMDFSPATETERRIDDTTAMEVDQQPTPEKEDEDEEIEVVREHVPPADGIEVANDDIMITDLLLDRPIEKFEIIEFVRLCVKAVYSLCLYCNHARRIAVCGHSLVLHLLAQHRFAATVDSITAEELLPATIVSKLKSFLPDLEQHYFNLESYSTLPPPPGSSTATTICNERIFECFQCRFSTRMHKDLYLHNRKMHLKTAILCFMCRANFFSFSEILCHICPGAPNKATVFDIKFRCCLCEVDGIPSPFRLMVHLRKKHFACDICLEDCLVQAKLSSHVWKHKLHHLCYRCGIAYRNKMDITKHLFWKHGTESIICKRCLQKRWRHVYHFCVPPTSFTCDVCSLCFSKATYLKVHQREHTGDFRYPCTEDNCEEKFVSRKLLLKHSIKHAPPPEEIKPKEEEVEQQKEEKDDKEEHASQEELQVKEEGKEASAQKDEKPQLAESTEVKEEETKSEEKKAEVTKEVSSKRKKKRSRNKESLEDLNLIAPNLSESDSSSESDVEKPKTDELVPNVMLSPPSEEEEKDEEDKPSETAQKDTEKIMDIWENFKSFQAQQAKKDDDAGDDDDIKSFTESDYPTPILHVAMSDHDYCAMYKVRPRPPRVEVPSSKIPDDSLTTDDIHSDTEAKVHELMKRKQESVSPNKKKRKSTTGSHSSSSGSSSDSSSRSSCSCKTNCSCSSSSSGSGSSSSSDDSDSSTSEGRRRVLKKREERAERNRLKSESSQKMSFSENVDVGGVDEREPVAPVVVKDKQEPIFIETDLETAESETDEEFYDEHPQKLASQMLAEKRLLLQEQMRLSPSHNFDIMENSRPSTPSLPEEMLKEKKVKLKKKKRDRKSSCKSQAIPPIKLNLSINKVEILSNEPVVRNQTAMQVPEVDLVPPYDLIASPGVAEPPIAQQPISTPTIQNHTVKPVPFFHTRMSEGSSCSDADSSLKRSQRARRPNKFYGYTSDDENIPGTPLMIGTRTFKPQPPPQLTWRKEDLPAPSKSILLNKQPRTAKTPSGQRGQLKKRLHQKTNSLKKKQHRLPPIPTLKIRPPKPNKPPFVAVALPPPPPPVVTHHQSSYSSSRDESDDSDSSDEEMELPATNTVSAASVIPRWNSTPAPVVIEPTPAPPPPPQAPQATAFNQKIPPALLPNPDFATLQYFKRNNIRYPIAPPAGARQPREGESVYCYCRCPYDEVSEMIACDGDNCMIEWFHFECVGIMVAPQGKWFCAECRPKYSNELYPQLS